MSEWKEYKLGDVAEIQTGPFGSQLHQRDYKVVGTPIITVEHLGENRVLHQNLPLVGDTDKERLKKYIIYDGDIVFSRVGSVDRRAYVSKRENGWMFSGRLLRVRPDRKRVSPKYLSYYFGQEDFKEHIRRIAVGATMPSINTSILSGVDILLPPLPEQRAIASVLSSLDDKIDLLHRQNKTLEAMAETLFRQWFVEEADEGWEVAKLGKYIKCTTGYSYKSVDLNPSNNALVTLKNFGRDGSFRMDGFKEYTGKYKDTQIAKQGDLVVSHTDITHEADIIGNPALVIDTGQFETLIITMDLMKVESNVDWLSKEFLYYLFKSPDFKFYCLGCSNGTTVLHMSRNAIPEYEFIIPSENMVKNFTATVVPILEKMFKNTFQICTLEKLRDTLLPKLMSGEVRVEMEASL